jgi:hypothetical protein
MKFVALLLLVAAAPVASVLLKSDACSAEDIKHRVALQNNLAGACVEMCKEIGAYPKGCTCPGFAQPDATPGVMTWEELLPHLDNLAAWGKESIKEWKAQAAALAQEGVSAVVQGAASSQACTAMDLKHRSMVQNKLASACEDMCKEIGAYPDCECPDFAAPDSTPGVMTWEELLEHMDNLEAWSVEQIKAWKGRAASMIQQVNATKNATATKKVKKEALSVTFKGGAGAENTVAVGCGTCVNHNSQGVYPKMKVCGTGMVAFYKDADCVEPATVQSPALCKDADAPGTVRSMKGVAC